MGVFFLFLSLENNDFLIYLEKILPPQVSGFLLNNKNYPLLISGLEFE
jgi:hypothetical protein